jgi:hypothetical protein
MTSATNPKTIVLSPVEGVQREGIAAADILPGKLVRKNEDGNIEPVSDAGAQGQIAFATAFVFTGRTIDDAYEEGDQIVYSVLPEGVEVYAFLADDETVTPGTLLTAAAGGVNDGSLTAATEGTAIYAVALEEVTTLVGAPARIRVETLKGTVPADEES